MFDRDDTRVLSQLAAIIVVAITMLLIVAATAGAFWRVFTFVGGV